MQRATVRGTQALGRNPETVMKKFLLGSVPLVALAATLWVVVADDDADSERRHRSG